MPLDHYTEITSRNQFRLYRVERRQFAEMKHFIHSSDTITIIQMRRMYIVEIQDYYILAYTYKNMSEIDPSD